MDPELEQSSVLTSDALRAAALAASARRGVPVARRRIALRWSVWLLWGWLLPLIGAVTVLAALLMFAFVTYWGPARVIDVGHTWLAEQLGLPANKSAIRTFDDFPGSPSGAIPNFNASAPSVIPQLQIDRNYSRQEAAKAAGPEAPTAPADSTVLNPSSPSKPLGAQP